MPTYSIVLSTPSTVYKYATSNVSFLDSQQKAWAGTASVLINNVTSEAGVWSYPNGASFTTVFAGTFFNADLSSLPISQSEGIKSIYINPISLNSYVDRTNSSLGTYGQPTGYISLFLIPPQSSVSLISGSTTPTLSASIVANNFSFIPNGTPNYRWNIGLTDTINNSNKILSLVKAKGILNFYSTSSAMTISGIPNDSSSTQIMSYYNSGTTGNLVIITSACPAGFGPSTQRSYPQGNISDISTVYGLQQSTDIINIPYPYNLVKNRGYASIDSGLISASTLTLSASNYSASPVLGDLIFAHVVTKMPLGSGSGVLTPSGWSLIDSASASDNNINSIYLNTFTKTAAGNSGDNLTVSQVSGSSGLITIDAITMINAASIVVGTGLITLGRPTIDILNAFLPSSASIYNFKNYSYNGFAEVSSSGQFVGYPYVSDTIINRNIFSNNNGGVARAINFYWRSSTSIARYLYSAYNPWVLQWNIGSLGTDLAGFSNDVLRSFVVFPTQKNTSAGQLGVFSSSIVTASNSTIVKTFNISDESTLQNFYMNSGVTQGSIVSTPVSASITRNYSDPYGTILTGPTTIISSINSSSVGALNANFFHPSVYEIGNSIYAGAFIFNTPITASSYVYSASMFVSGSVLPLLLSGLGAFQSPSANAAQVNAGNLNNFTRIGSAASGYIVFSASTNSPVASHQKSSGSVAFFRNPAKYVKSPNFLVGYSKQIGNKTSGYSTLYYQYSSGSNPAVNSYSSQTSNWWSGIGLTNWVENMAMPSFPCWDGDRWVSYSSQNFLFVQTFNQNANDSGSAANAYFSIPNNPFNFTTNSLYSIPSNNKSFLENPFVSYASAKYYITGGQLPSGIAVFDQGLNLTGSVTFSRLGGYSAFSTPNNLVTYTGIVSAPDPSLYHFPQSRADKLIQIISSSNQGVTWTEWPGVSTSAYYPSTDNTYMIQSPLLYFNNRYFFLIGRTEGTQVFSGRLVIFSSSSLGGPWSGSISSTSGVFKLRSPAISSSTGAVVLAAGEGFGGSNGPTSAIFSNNGYNWTPTASITGGGTTITPIWYSQDSNQFIGVGYSNAQSGPASLWWSNTGSATTWNSYSFFTGMVNAYQIGGLAWLGH